MSDACSLCTSVFMFFFFFSSRRRHTRCSRDWSSDVCSSDLYEFTHFVGEGLTLQQNLFGSTFFVLTGFHGAHVTVGVVWLLSLWLLDLRGNLAVVDAMKVEVAGLYWHFVDVVWIVIFTLVYLIP